MAVNKQNTVGKVESLVTPFADELGLKIWDIRYLKEGASWFLRIFIDKEGGVDIDDCEKLSRAIDEPLDTADIIKDAYFLEVSSPGLFRELTRPEHFKEFEGVDVTVRLIRPIDKIKEFSGELVGLQGQNIVLNISGTQREFEKSTVSKVFVNDEL